MPWGLFILLALGLILGWAMLVLYTAYVLSHPTRRGYAYAVARNLPGDPSEITCGDPPHRGLEYTEWNFRSRGQELPVWDISGLDSAGPTIIITHGWGDSRVVMLSRLAALAPMASRVIMWDLPAHGDSPNGGFTLGANEYESLLALYERVSESPQDTNDGRIVLYGSSLGAGVSIFAAHAMPLWRITGHRAPAGVIAESPYRLPITPARNVLRIRGLPYRSNIGPAIALLRLRFGSLFADRNFDRAKMPTESPLLILHGTLDPVCPVQDGREIAAAARSASIVEIPGGGHNNLWTEPAFSSQCVAAIAKFLPPLQAFIPIPRPPAKPSDAATTTIPSA